MRRIVPLGDRVLVKRRKVGEKLGASKIIVAADVTKERSTDLADVVEVPELTEADRMLIENSEEIVKAQAVEARKGNSEALKSLLEFNIYLKIKSLRPGDFVFMSRYSGVDFHTNESPDMMTVINGQDIIGIIYEEDK